MSFVHHTSVLLFRSCTGHDRKTKQQLAGIMCFSL
nr:MAG TPA: hypothetical protein [Caudoviricetes sp.]